MKRGKLSIKNKDNEWHHYVAVTCVCIFEDMHHNDHNIDEPVLYFQQRRKTKRGEKVREMMIPLSQIKYMSY